MYYKRKEKDEGRCVVLNFFILYRHQVTFSSLILLFVSLFVCSLTILDLPKRDHQSGLLFPSSILAANKSSIPLGRHGSVLSHSLTYIHIHTHTAHYMACRSSAAAPFFLISHRRLQYRCSDTEAFIYRSITCTNTSMQAGTGTSKRCTYVGML